MSYDKFPPADFSEGDFSVMKAKYVTCPRISDPIFLSWAPMPIFVLPGDRGYNMDIINSLSEAMYHLYILECADGSLYTGIAVDVERRVAEHNGSGKGAKYTKARRPVKLVFSKEFKNRSSASKEEARVKKLSREEKLGMINGM